MTKKPKIKKKINNYNYKKTLISAEKIYHKQG